MREIDVENLEEIEGIVQIEKESFGDGGIDEWVVKPIARYGKIYIIKYESKLIGFVEMLKKWGKDEVYIYSFAIKGNMQGKSFGKKLMEYTINQLKKEKISKLSLTVNGENIHAVKLYEKFGFKKIKTLKDEYGRGVHRVYMEKDDLLD